LVPTEAEIDARMREMVAESERARAAWWRAFAEDIARAQAASIKYFAEGGFERDAAASMRALVDAYSQRKRGFSGI
jgi:hypothetical protein